jgi:hypothetical protein
MSADRTSAAVARVLLAWLNERFDARFDALEPRGDAFVATDGAHRAGVYVAPLWEDDAAWQSRLRAIEERFSASGAYLLWVPPQAPLPADEPDVSAFVRRVEEAAATLAPGETAEVTFPVTVKLAKTREEGGYASVVGGLSRWWTRITENVQGTYSVDSSALHRLTHDGDAREGLWQEIGELSKGVGLGQGAEFEVDEAWTLQRLPATQAGLPEADDGLALAGAPPGVDPTEGIAVRRLVRKRLAAANEALGALDVELRAVGLIGCYEYAEVETAGATVKALDPSLFAGLEVVCVLADGGVRPVFLPRSLPWASA